jgi:hypothetical protein
MKYYTKAEVFAQGQAAGGNGSFLQHFEHGTISQSYRGNPIEVYWRDKGQKTLDWGVCLGWTWEPMNKNYCNLGGLQHPSERSTTDKSLCSETSRCGNRECKVCTPNFL